MGFFRALERAVAGGMAPQNMPDHPCLACQTPMAYRGMHVLRTGGVSGGAVGVGVDMLFGTRDENFVNQMTERNVHVHVLVCPSCGRIEFINDPQRGF